MCQPLLRAVDKFKKHRVRYVQSGQLIESTRRQEDFAAVIHIFSFRTRQHDNRIASIILVEAARSSSSSSSH